MLTLDEAARKELDAYFDGKETSPIRIYLAPGGCSGPRLALALDNPNDEDTVVETQGHSFCINKELMTVAEAITISFNHAGFFVESAVPMGGGDGGCGGCGSGGGHSSGGCSGGCHE